MKRIYRTMQGKEIDMEQLMARNETMPAVGNVRVNARGDELGPGGKIIRKREDVIAQPVGNGVVQEKTATKKNVASMDPEGNE